MKLLSRRSLLSDISKIENKLIVLFLVFIIFPYSVNSFAYDIHCSTTGGNYIVDFNTLNIPSGVKAGYESEKITPNQGAGLWSLTCTRDPQADRDIYVTFSTNESPVSGYTNVYPTNIPGWGILYNFAANSGGDNCDIGYDQHLENTKLNFKCHLLHGDDQSTMFSLGASYQFVKLADSAPGGAVNSTAVVSSSTSYNNQTGSDSQQIVYSGAANGTIIVPGVCTINSGSNLNIDFGTFLSGSFKNKGQMPDGFTPKKLSVPISCSDLESGTKLHLSLEGNAASDTSAIKTDNADVGVSITDDSGNVVSPNNGVIPFEINGDLDSQVSFNTYPVNVTGNTPAEGVFHAQAYLVVNFD
ncbi:TPA: fimbrial protein [Klebsiella michiganensis]|nr:fimbrial protein [Klebsiella michiganensis]